MFHLTHAEHGPVFVRQVPNGTAHPFRIFVVYHHRLCASLSVGRVMPRQAFVRMGLESPQAVDAKITGDGHTHGRNVLFPVKPVSDKLKFEHGFLYDVFRLVLIRQIETRDVYEFAS